MQPLGKESYRSQPAPPCLSARMAERDRHFQEEIGGVTTFAVLMRTVLRQRRFSSVSMSLTAARLRVHGFRSSSARALEYTLMRLKTLASNGEAAPVS